MQSPQALGSGVSRPTICDDLRRRLFSQQAQAFVQNILGSVDVSVVVRAANRTHPFAHGKVFRPSPLLAAGRAQLAGWIEPVHHTDRFAAPICPVRNLATELAPCRVADGLRQLMVFIFSSQSITAILHRHFVFSGVFPNPRRKAGTLAA